MEKIIKENIREELKNQGKSTSDSNVNIIYRYHLNDLYDSSYSAIIRALSYKLEK